MGRRLGSARTQSALFIRDRVMLMRERRRFATLPTELRDRVSVPIATFDRIDTLVERTIPALLDQTHRDVEIIIVGDGTPAGLFSRLDSIDDPPLACDLDSARAQHVLMYLRARLPESASILDFGCGLDNRN